MKHCHWTIEHETSSIMKACAMLFIILHNLLHANYFGYAQENEFWYSDNNVIDFFDRAFPLGINTIGNLFSYIGWIGVSAFFFLSGYGLAKKYPQGSFIDFGKYIFHSFYKLFVLLAPALFYFALVEKQGTLGFIRAFFPLSMLNNLVVTIFPFSPGVYWFFGCIFELYLLFLHWRRKTNNELCIWIVVLLLLQIIAFEFEPQVPWFRVWIKYNFTGWGQIFILGISAARNNRNLSQKTVNIFWLFVFMFTSLFFSCAIQFSKILWLVFVPFISILFFFSTAKIIESIGLIKPLFLWIGKYSAVIFVTHPIIRSLTYMFLTDTVNNYLLVILYLSGCMLSAVIYSILYNFLLGKETKMYSWLKMKQQISNFAK